MTIDQLRQLCCEAAADLAGREERPWPVTVVLPGPEATRVVALDGFPGDDRARHTALSVFAAEHMVPHDVPCFGFIAEATSAEGTDLLTVVYGARRQRPMITAAPVTGEGLGDFVEPEPLDPAALPFLQPLQHAADLAAG